MCKAGFRHNWKSHHSLCCTVTFSHFFPWFGRNYREIAPPSVWWHFARFTPGVERGTNLFMWGNFATIAWRAISLGRFLGIFGLLTTQSSPYVGQAHHWRKELMTSTLLTEKVDNLSPNKNQGELWVVKGGMKLGTEDLMGSCRRRKPKLQLPPG